jgi:heme exporter protein B
LTAGLGAVAVAIALREIRHLGRSPVTALTGVLFFVIAASLFPLALQPDPDTLRTVGPGVLWVTAMFAILVSAPRVFAADHASGWLEQLLLAPSPLALTALVKVGADWFVATVPLLVVTPLIALQLNLPWHAMGWLIAGLALGTPTVALLAAVSAALTLGTRASGAISVLIALPLCTPVLVFGAGAAQAAVAGGDPIAGISLLGACLALALALVPVGIAAALRVTME